MLLYKALTVQIECHPHRHTAGDVIEDRKLCKTSLQVYFSPQDCIDCIKLLVSVNFTVICFAQIKLLPVTDQTPD